MEELNTEYEQLKKSLPEDHVLRYVGELKGDLQKEKGQLEVKLVSVPKSASLGQGKRIGFYFRNLYRILW